MNDDRIRTANVHYSRREYAEYLRSDEWRKLRALVLSVAPDCQCCKAVPASQVHHMDYRNIVNVRVTDLLPVCGECHALIHRAIRLHIIPKQQIHEHPRALIVNHAALANSVKGRGSKGKIKGWLAKTINESDIQTQRLVCGVLRILHPGDFNSLVGAKVSNHSITRIKMVLFQRDALFRRLDRRSAEKRLKYKLRKEAKAALQATPA